MGIRASSRKRLAEAAFTLTAHTSRDKFDDWRDPYELLDQAWLDYDRAARGLLVNESSAAQRVATLHWVLVQVESLSVVLEGCPMQAAGRQPNCAPICIVIIP